MSEDRPVPGWWLSSGGSLRSGNPVVIGMHPFERGAEDIRGSTASKSARSLSRTAFALKSRQISGLRYGIPSADTPKTSGYGRRIDVSRRQIQVSPSCGSRNTSNRHT